MRFSKRFLRQAAVFFVLPGLLLSFMSIQSLRAKEPQPWDAQDSENAAKKEMDFDDAMADSETQGVAEGSVLKVNPGSNTIILKDDRSGSDMYSAPVYHINSDTTLEGAASISDISAGDRISIDYFIVDNKNIADNIVMEKRSYSRDSGSIDSGVPKVLVD